MLDAIGPDPVVISAIPHPTVLEGLHPIYITDRRGIVTVTTKRSRHAQARIEPRFTRWVLTGLRDGESVLINGHRMYEPTAIFPGDQVQIGSVILAVRGTIDQPTLAASLVSPREPRATCITHTVPSHALPPDAAHPPVVRQAWRSGWLVASIVIAMGLLMATLATPTAIRADQRTAGTTAYLLDASGSQIDAMPAVLHYLRNELANLSPARDAVVVRYGGEGETVSPFAARHDRRALQHWVDTLASTTSPHGRGDIAGAVALAVAHFADELVILSDLADADTPAQLAAALDALPVRHCPRLQVVQFFSDDHQQQFMALAADTGGSYRWIDLIVAPISPAPLEPRWSPPSLSQLTR